MRAVFARAMARNNEPGTLRRQVALTRAEVIMEGFETDPNNARPGQVYAAVVRLLQSHTLPPDEIIMAIWLDRLRNRRGVGLNVLVDNDMNLTPDDMSILKAHWYHHNLFNGSPLEELFPPWWELWHHMEEARRMNRFVYRMPVTYDRPDGRDEVDGDADEQRYGRELLNKIARKSNEEVPIYYGYKKHWDDDEDGFGEDVETVMVNIENRARTLMRRKPQFVSKNTKCTNCLAINFRVWQETMMHEKVSDLPPIRAVRLFSRIYPSPGLLSEVKELMRANVLPTPELQRSAYETRHYDEMVLNKDGTTSLINVELELEVLCKALQFQEVDTVFECLVNSIPNNYVRCVIFECL